MENNLALIVKESGLESTKAKYILENFQNYFEIAAEWEAKAKTIRVTDASQTADMEMARVGRLFLREKRIAIEKARKELKEQALREGKAIDGIANVLKALIVPVEEYLDQQEHFVEIQQQKEREKLLLEAQQKEEEERIAKEKAYAEELEKKRIENEKLKKEAEAKEKALAKERATVEAEKKALEEKNRKEREAIEKKAKIEREKALAVEREKQEKKLAEERAKAEKERKAREAQAAAERKKAELKLAQERKARLKVEKILKEGIDCPYCGKKISFDKES
uniref:Uncharacterized protein n=1 Tax=viral metagenome TaxID=1070528 RepID=A0A6H1ZEP0_9ZZZZ